MFKKNNLYFVYALICYFVVSNYHSYGQNSNKEAIINPILTDISEVLPPLEVLFDSAYANVASYKAKSYNVDYQSAQINFRRRSCKWLFKKASHNLNCGELFEFRGVK